MIFEKGKIEFVESYKDTKIVIEHNLNIIEKVKETDFPIYTLCGLGRTTQGSIESIRTFIDLMIEEYK